MSSGTWLNSLVLYHPIGLFLLHFNSNAPFGVLFYLISLCMAEPLVDSIVILLANF